MIWPDGSKYEGNWDHGIATGQGNFYYANKDVYKGLWHLNKSNGVGIYINS
jgi:radial spoke head protein 1